jgi:hypothetical protein
MPEPLPRVKAVKVYRGLYELRGVTHTRPRNLGGPVCGGRVFAERFSTAPPEWRWECFCEACKKCDPDGWPTLRDCLREAPAFWTQKGI